MCFSTAAGSRPVQPATTACAIATSPDRVPDLSCNVRGECALTRHVRHLGREIWIRRALRERGRSARRSPGLDMSLTWSFQLREMTQPEERTDISSFSMRTLAQLKAEFAGGGSSRALLEQCLARIADRTGEGERVFLKVHGADALAAADLYDRLRARGAPPSPFAGIPISIKDLFDVAGDVTTAGSRALKDAEPAARDAPSVARLRAAGFIPIGRTN